MKCQDITQILDDADISRLDEAERARIDVHLSGCRNCADEWRVHRRLVQGFAPPVPEGLKERARALVVAQSVSNVRRLRNRSLAIGAMVALAAAAAGLGWKFSPSPTGEAGNQQSVSAASAQPGAAVTAGQTADQRGQTQPAVPASSGAFTVRVLPLVTQGNDAAGNSLAQAFRQKLIAKLRDVPGLLLLDEFAQGQSAADFHVRVSYTPGPSTDYVAEVDAGAPEVVDELARLAAGTPQQRREYARRRASLTPANPPSASGIVVSSSVSFPTTVSLDRSPDALVDLTVQGMRVRVFPLDPSFRSELLVRVADASRPSAQRLSALGDVLSMAQSRGGAAPVDAETIRAGAELALSVPDVRTREGAWEALRRTRLAELVPYLVRGLEAERETRIRLEIVQILATNFVGDPQARAALENVAQREAEPVVRMAALRNLQGDARWNEFAAAILANTSLTDRERLQPIADMVESATQTGKVGFQLSDPSLRELATVIGRAARDDSRSDATRNAARNAMGVLVVLESPIIRDVLIDVMRLPEGERGVAILAINTIKDAAVRAATARFRGDSRLRTAMEELANSHSPSSAAARNQLQIWDGPPQVENSSRP